MRNVLVACVVAVCCVSLYAQPQVEAKGKPAELLISAAASLTDCMDELKAAYMQEHPQVTIKANYGSSGALQQQIEQGAPVDIFFSAGVAQMTALKDKGFMSEGTVRDLLENKLVLIIPVGGKNLSSFQDLAAQDIVRIAVGDPKSVPAGQYAEEAFRTLALFDAIKGKLIYAKDVREVLTWVETGNVQAGLVYETDAKISKKVVISAVAPEGSHKRVIYPVGVLKESKYPEEAKAFVDYFFTDEAKAVFARYGFTVI